jgi:hypothetical protein
MKKLSNEDSQLLRDWLIYGMNLSFNRLIDEKRKNNDVFVFGENGKVKFVNAHDVPYRELNKPEKSLETIHK